MDTSLDSVISYLQNLRQEAGGDAAVRIEERNPEGFLFLTALENIEVRDRIVFSGYTERAIKEVVIIPYISE